MRVHQARRPRVEAERATRQPHRVFQGAGRDLRLGVQEALPRREAPLPLPRHDPPHHGEGALLSFARRSATRRLRARLERHVRFRASTSRAAQRTHAGDADDVPETLFFPRTSHGHEFTKRIRETKRNELPSNRPSQDKPKEEKITWSVPDVSEYDALVAEWEGKKWRMLPKPGGAVVKPDDWYALHGLQKQVEEGNVKAEKPMWASHGGLDFDGRERWEKWNAAKGLSAEDAKLKFCQAYGKAMSDERNALNFRKY